MNKKLIALFVLILLIVLGVFGYLTPLSGTYPLYNDTNWSLLNSFF